MSICSIHKNPVKRCKMCEGTPWELLGVSQKEFEDGVNDARSEGLLTCPNCGFDGMFKKTCRKEDGSYHCPCCDECFEYKEPNI